MTKCPSAVWIVDTKKEHIAVDEARKLGIPVVAILDTNCDPDEVDYPIPGNDDAIRSAALLTRVIADAVAEGLHGPRRRRRPTPAARTPASRPSAPTSRWPTGSASCSRREPAVRRRAAEPATTPPGRRCPRPRRRPRPPAADAPRTVPAAAESLRRSRRHRRRRPPATPERLTPND